MQRAVFKGGDGNRADVAEIIRLGRADGVPKASGQTEYGECRAKEILHGVGDALLSGVADGAGVGETAGAVVLTGLSEAGGGRETSSGGGNGATSVGEERIAGPPWGGSPVCAIIGFFFGAFACARICFTSASPTLLRSSSMRFSPRLPGRSRAADESHHYNK